MAVTYRTSLKNARLQAVIDDIGAGGLLKIGTVAMGTVLAVVPLANPAFDAPAGGAMNLAGVPILDNAADGTDEAAAAQITKADGTVVVDGLTVGTAGAHIILNSTAIQVGQEVRINSGTITHG